MQRESGMDSIACLGNLSGSMGLGESGVADEAVKMYCAGQG